MRKRTNKLIEFDHGSYGLKIRDLFEGDSEAEPHCSIILRLNNVEKLAHDTFEITRGLPLQENVQLLIELKKSCNKTISRLRRLLQKYDHLQPK